MMKIGIVYLLLSAIVSCDNSDVSVMDFKLESRVEDCLQLEQEERKVIAIFTDVKGMVIAPGEKGCPSLYTIKGGPMVEGRSVEYLWACNMPENLNKDGLEITFSGNLYETLDTENICAQSFLLTDINPER